MGRDTMLLFGGSGSPELARKICACLSIISGRAEVLQFPAGDLFACVLENVRASCDLGGLMMYVFVSSVVTGKAALE